MESINYVARLNEKTQKTRSEPRYEDVGAVGPDHSRTFTIRVVLNGKAYPDGVGKNKKEARQKAAENALRSLEEESLDFTGNVPEAPTAPVHQTSITQTNYVCWLNEYGHRNKVEIKPMESTNLEQNNATPCCFFVVGDKKYPAATGKTKKEAKEEAAKLVYNDMQVCGSKTTETEEQKSMSPSQIKDKLNQSVSDVSEDTADEGFREINFIGLINNYCQKTHLTHDYVLVDKCGPPHNSQFFYKLVINKRDYPVGEGRSGREARQNAAQQAWSVLEGQSDWDSRQSYGSAVSDDVSTSGSTTLSKLEDCEQNSNDKLSTTSDSVVFTDSPIPSKHQIPSPDKPKIKLAANFLNANNSKEELINFKCKKSGSSQSEKRATPAVSRFKSEFDSFVQLGTGAFGIVFKAKEKLVEKYYAVKIVRWKEKSLREVKALSDLFHCNIVRYYTCWTEESGFQWDSSSDSSSSSQSPSDSLMNFLYIKMELCSNTTLRMWIDEKNSQNVRDKRKEESLTFVKQIISGVEYIHSKKLIHRDLKPDNIMFGQDENIKIGDFGLVTAQTDDNEKPVERSVYKGTPSYMAPEQKSRNTYDRRVDIFALGLVYFELLWNLPTYQERKLIWDDVRNQKLPQGFLHHFPNENLIIKSMLSEKPEDRPEAKKLKMELEEYTQALQNRDMKTV